MPHVVFDKKIDLEEFSKQFQPVMKRDSGIIKLIDVFVNKNNDRALITALTIDDLHQEFIIELDAKVGSSTLRLFPMTDPKKTASVKTALGLVASFVLYLFPDARIIRTNIQEFIAKKIIVNSIVFGEQE
ncbi:MAG: hypothetical protein D4R90_05570 [Nitrosopumilales archaeon]|nr:MAG: hypothetical protein D4R90_05570 [Nitrosopumilales archaeon]